MMKVKSPALAGLFVADFQCKEFGRILRNEPFVEFHPRAMKLRMAGIRRLGAADNASGSDYDLLRRYPQLGGSMLANAAVAVLTTSMAQIAGAQAVPAFARCPIRIASAIPIVSIEHKAPVGKVHQLAIRFDPFGPTVYGYDMVLHGPPSAESGAEGGETQSFQDGGNGRAIAASTVWTGKLDHVQWFEFTRLDLGNGVIWRNSEIAVCEFLPLAARDSSELPGSNPPTR